ncbi:hypothetical protein VIGAN_03058300 [Vigna angularis var. angularis]|uniref:Uncharacterized protein n=1 Tax=Vigna angularis var. angularis TaxID=157739 RepID=A0A0S3RK28_PHAAN|nr:hypothetical protein VIGAN_03058300 [Vigna angularis var. angularis]
MSRCPPLCPFPPKWPFFLLLKAHISSKVISFFIFYLFIFFLLQGHVWTRHTSILISTSKNHGSLSQTMDLHCCRIFGSFCYVAVAHSGPGTSLLAFSIFGTNSCGNAFATSSVSPGTCGRHSSWLACGRAVICSARVFHHCRHRHRYHARQLLLRLSPYALLLLQCHDVFLHVLAAVQHSSIIKIPFMCSSPPSFWM